MAAFFDVHAAKFSPQGLGLGLGFRLELGLGLRFVSGVRAAYCLHK